MSKPNIYQALSAYGEGTTINNWADLVLAHGGHVECTGGNCRAYRIDVSDSYYWLITDDADLPEHDAKTAIVCAYYHDRPAGNDDDGDMTLPQAIKAITDSI